MSESFELAAKPAIGKRSNQVQGTALHCGGIHVRAARGIWPRKTAENWAEAAGVKTRIAQYWLAGREVSEAGKLALIRLLG